jgi:hypothetical protein
MNATARTAAVATDDNQLATVATRLSERSAEEASNPRMPLPWPPRMPAEAWCMSPELISIFGTPMWDALDESGRRRLAFLECSNFFALNIHGERALMEGIARRLYARDLAPYAHYLHHFLAEENQHMTWFGGFCQRYAGKIYPDRKLVLPREHAPGEEDLLFFARVLVFELIVDGYNQRMAKDGRLHPLVCEINRRHHEDESRHLAFGRLVVEDLWTRHSPRWAEEVREGVRQYMASYVEATWREYYNPDVYRDAGFSDPYQLARDAFAAPAARARRDEVQRRCVRILDEIGLWPQSKETRS